MYEKLKFCRLEITLMIPKVNLRVGKMGELIVYHSLRRPSVNIFKHLLL